MSQLDRQVLDAVVGSIWDPDSEGAVGAGRRAVLGGEAYGPLDDATSRSNLKGVLVAEVDCKGRSVFHR